jgi:hypothetical protein
VSPAVALLIAIEIVGKSSGTMIVFDCALTVEEGSKTIDIKKITSNNAKVLPILPIVSNRHV